MVWQTKTCETRFRKPQYERTIPISLQVETRNYRQIQQRIGNLGHPLRSLLGEQLFPGLGLRLRLGAHDATSPLLPDLIELVIEVRLE